VPKTVTENGKTYTLAGVEWKAGNYETIDYEQLPEYYTAVAAYTATGTSTKVTGYVVTAVYNGTLAKLAQGKTVYTAYFTGEEIRTPLEMTELSKLTEATTSEPTAEPTENVAITATDTTSATDTVTATAEPTETPAAEATETPSTDGETTKNNNALFVIIPIIAVLAGAAFYFLKIKGRKSDEKTTDTTADAGVDGDGDDSGTRG
jgi:hypothetical protein